MTSLLPASVSREVKNRLVRLFLEGKKLSKRQALEDEKVLGTVPRDPIRYRIAKDIITSMYASLKAWFFKHEGKNFGIVDDEDMGVFTKKVYVKAQNGVAGHWKDVEVEKHYNRFGLLDNGNQLAYRVNKYLSLYKGINKNVRRNMQEGVERKFELPAPVKTYKLEIPYVQTGLLKGEKDNG